MDATTVLAGLLLFLAVGRCHSNGEMLLNLEVKGNFAVKTGIQKYTIYQNPSTKVDNVAVTCSTPLSLPANISLIKGNEIIAENYSTGTEIRVIKSYPSTSSDVTGIFTCRVSIALYNTNESFMEYTFASKLEINTTERHRKYICGSSIGGSGYLGERVSVTCEGVFRNFPLNWLNTSSPHEITLSSPYLGLECGYMIPGKWRLVCLPPSIRIHQILSVTLSSLNHTFDSLVTGYICRSSPARKMKWEVIGSYGNILNSENMHLSTRFGTKVNITQSFGETYLWISESVPGGNGIHKIICSTYDTTGNAFSSTQIFPHTSHEIQSSDDYASTTSQILTQETPGGGENENILTTSTEESNVMVNSSGCVEWKTITITFLLIFLSLNIFVCYLYLKKYQIVVSTSTANNRQHQRRKTETEFVKNPIYVSASSPPDNTTGASFYVTGPTSKGTEIVRPEENKTYAELV